MSAHFLLRLFSTEKHKNIVVAVFHIPPGLPLPKGARSTAPLYNFYI